jgi:ABC-2 type transport system ATP-binding protein
MPTGSCSSPEVVVADGPATEIKARVGSRAIRATLPGVDVAQLRALAGVLGAERHGEAVSLSCSDTDAALSALLRSFPGNRDVAVRGANLEEAFFEDTNDEDGTGTREAAHEASNHESRKESR